MNDNDLKLRKLREDVTTLARRLQTLEQRVDKIARIGMKFDEANGRHCTRLQQGQDDAFDRITNLELAVFPDLARDIQDVHDIIGEGDNRANQPLDRRDRSKFSGAGKPKSIK
jgi:hypothetical protein